MNYQDINRKAWDHRARIHIKSKFYNVPGFLQGMSSLNEIELQELPPVAGCSLLHLQCHFGLDTLSLARMGAEVTGVDISPVAIDQARQLSEEAKIPADFICADIDEFGTQNRQSYDIVFTSYGTLCWLPDLAKWAGTVARALKPGGVFYMAEFHPTWELVSGYPYFFRSEPDIESSGTYTENDPGEKQDMCLWSHHLSEVITALLNAGLRLVRLNEYPYSPYKLYDLREKESGRYYCQHKDQTVPLIYTITAEKP